MPLVEGKDVLAVLLRCRRTAPQHLRPSRQGLQLEGPPRGPGPAGAPGQHPAASREGATAQPYRAEAQPHPEHTARHHRAHSGAFIAGGRFSRATTWSRPNPMGRPFQGPSVHPQPNAGVLGPPWPVGPVILANNWQFMHFNSCCNPCNVFITLIIAIAAAVAFAGAICRKL